MSKLDIFRNPKFWAIHLGSPHSIALACYPWLILVINCDNEVCSCSNNTVSWTSTIHWMVQYTVLLQSEGQLAIRGSWFTKYNHLKSCIRYANALLSVIIFIVMWFYSFALDVIETRLPGCLVPLLNLTLPCFEERKNQAIICAAVPKLHKNMHMDRGSPAPHKSTNNFSTYRPIHTESPNEYCRKYLPVHR